MRPPMRAININACARPVEVDHRISLHYYYRIADNLLKQASIYREEKNLIDLYIILLRFSSLMCETIPSHRDYQAFNLKEKAIFKKKLWDVINELEKLKPEVQRQVDELNKVHSFQSDGPEGTYSLSPVTKQIFPGPQVEQIRTGSMSALSQKPSSGRSHVVPLDHVQPERQFQKLSISLPYPKEETLSRHSILGPNGLQGQWRGPVTGIRVQYPSSADMTQNEISGLLPDSLNQDVQRSSSAVDQNELEKNSYDMESVLSLDDGRWSTPLEEPHSLSASVVLEEPPPLSIKQLSPPPVLAQVQPEYKAIPPSKVADPRPGPAMSDSGQFQDLHVPVKVLECFLRVAEVNTAKNLETCGVLAGSLKNRIFYVTTLIIPKQKSTSDSCQATNEEEIFEVQDKHSLFTLGWIHTHPTQTCFMSSIDLHNHYSYQVMLPEAIAIVMAPTDTSRKHGIFHLTDPGGMSVMHNCHETGFHPHEEPADGSPIYEHCSHVYMNPNVKFDVVDLRNL
ncbi:AMSH-like ubiquitin thioesterase 3 [Ananas comosus]|uniref:AMSH-like ubiquitin thioesterase 3 n=1 Tax=Ananas comosus TaxID=4615 RepID=A0A6P5HCX5_ANACO|nr:AMSH-like ubiquitin thioesterase 3 [Ananas comosus]